MPTAEMYEQEAKRLASERDKARELFRAAERDLGASRALNAALNEARNGLVRDRDSSIRGAVLACQEWERRALQAERRLAAIAASRARRDKRRAAKLAAARIRFLCPGGPVPVEPDKRGGGL